MRDGAGSRRVALRRRIGRMRRRSFIAAIPASAAFHARAQEQPSRPRQKISAGELFNTLTARFPVRIPLTLIDLQLDAKSLLLVPARQKLGATLALQASGFQIRQADAGGELDTAFSLRYERSDRTLRARDPEILDLRWPGLAPDAVATLKGVLPRAARDAIGEFVLHQFTGKELALPDTMGFEPGKIEVVEDGLVIWFQPK